MTSTFGLAYLRHEGAPMHPDDTEIEWTDAQYLKQLRAYRDYYKLTVKDLESCVRNDLLELL